MALTNQIRAKFLFRYRAPTRISFGGWEAHQLEKPNGFIIDCQADKAQVVVFDETLPTTPKMHYGIGFDVEVEHTDIEQAQLVARLTVSELIAVMAFCEACYIGSPEFIFQYRAPENSKQLQDARFYVVDKDYRPIETSLRQFGFKRFEDVFFKVNNITDNNRRQTIMRSLHWFWKSLEDSHNIDRFLHLWTAVEHLEKPLKALYSIAESKTGYPKCSHCKRESVSCPNCNEDFGYKANTGFAGLKKIVVDCGLKKGLIDDLHSIRSKLVHQSVAKEQEIRQALDDTRALFSKTFFALVGIEPSMTNALPRQVRLQSRPMVMSLEGTIEVKDPLTLHDIHLQPIVYGTYTHKFVIDEKTGDLINLTDVQHEFHGAFVAANMEKKVLVDASQNVVDFWEREGQLTD